MPCAASALLCLLLAQTAPGDDYDRDGLPNLDDDCPTDAGNANNRGCPGDPVRAATLESSPGLAEVKGSIIVLARPIVFETGSARLAAGMDELVGAIAEVIQGLPADRGVIVRGHTDDRGKRAANLALSRKRADAVLAALVARGIDRKRLRSDGVGPDVPIADNRTAEGRAKNRRVELVIVEDRRR